MPKRTLTPEVQTQVNNIVETLRNFAKTDADQDDIADALVEVLNDDFAQDNELGDAFQDFADMIRDALDRF